jgi:hypothetical protein
MPVELDYRNVLYSNPERPLRAPAISNTRTTDCHWGAQSVGFRRHG